MTSDEDLRFTSHEFASLLKLAYWMDYGDGIHDSPLTVREQTFVGDVLREEARDRGYDGWEHAYDELLGGESE